MKILRVLFVICSGALALACDDTRHKTDRRSDAVGSQTTSNLLLPRPFSDAISKLKAASGPNPLALRLEVYPARMVLQAQDPKQDGRVLQYEFRAGRLEVPVAVEIRGTGDLAANLFSLSAVNLDAIPALAETAVARVDSENGKVSQVLVRRNLPSDDEITFRIYVQSPRQSDHVDADHTGKIIP